MEVLTIPLAGSSAVHSNNLKETVLPSHLSITSLGLWAIQILNLIQFPVHWLRSLLHILINNFSSDFQQIFPPQLKCMTVRWGTGCQQPPRLKEAALPTRPSQRRKGGGSTQGRFAYTSPTASFSLLKGREATRAQYQVLSPKTCRLLSWLLCLFTDGNAASQVRYVTSVEYAVGQHLDIKASSPPLQWNEMKNHKSEMTGMILAGKKGMTRSNQEMGTKITWKIMAALLLQDLGKRGNQRSMNVQHKKVQLFIVAWN